MFNFGGILISAALESGKPVDGNRFKGDLNPAITSSNTSSIKNSIEALSGVEKCDIELTSAQYRVNVDTVDTLTDKQIEDLCVDIYNIVNKELPMATYFTASSSEKMYDLAVNVYNKIDDDNIYYILTKNSKMDTYSVQCVSSAVDEELASDLRGENDIEEPTERMMMPHSYMRLFLMKNEIIRLECIDITVDGQGVCKRMDWSFLSRK